MGTVKQTEHPLIPKVGIGAVRRWAEEKKCTAEQALATLVNMRETALAAEKNEPYEFMMEPPIWNLVRALLGMRLRKTNDLKRAMERTGLDEEGMAEALRQACEMTHPAMTVLLLGGNRCGKTTLEMRLFMETLREQERAIAWAFHSNADQSQTFHQPLCHAMLQKHLRERDWKTKDTYVAFKHKGGFSEGSFVLPNLSRGVFKSYEMDRNRAIEGGNILYAACDELVPSDWVATLELRLAEKNGHMVVGFTPLEGYSETVRMFLDGARWVRTTEARLLPLDGKDPDVAGQLGLTDEELAAYEAWVNNPKKAPYPQVFCRTTDVYGWVERRAESREHGAGGGERRRFRRVPVVAKAVDADERRVVVWIHSQENAFGNPLSVWKTIAHMDEENKARRFYGLATKSYSTLAAKFNRAVHVLPDDAMPKDGTDYLVIDPAGARNWAMAWVRATRDGLYWIEEWPSQVNEVPELGVLGAWAVPDGKRKDGRPGPAQKGIGWGILAYKREVARIEGWACYRAEDGLEAVRAWKREQRAEDGGRRAEDGGRRTEGGERGRRIRVFREFVDARYAAIPSQGETGLRTLLDELHEANWLIEAASTSGAVDGRNAISEGTQLVNGALDYDTSQPVGFGNRPGMFFSDRCKNLIYAMENHTGEDGQKGATKDFFDLVRLALLTTVPYVGDGEAGVRCVGGGSY
jgi:hypothetical protein